MNANKQQLDPKLKCCCNYLYAELEC